MSTPTRKVFKIEVLPPPAGDNAQSPICKLCIVHINSPYWFDEKKHNRPGGYQLGYKQGKKQPYLQPYFIKNQKILMSVKISMRHLTKVVLCLAVLSAFFIQTLSAQKTKSHNPVIDGWYADPEGVILENKYWIFPTYSAKYKQQVFLDAFSSTDMVTWKKHPKIIDTSIIKWAYMAMWAPSIVKKR